jgi:hypothetical protein
LVVFLFQILDHHLDMLGVAAIHGDGRIRLVIAKAAKDLAFGG